MLYNFIRPRDFTLLHVAYILQQITHVWLTVILVNMTVKELRIEVHLNTVQ